MGKEVTRCVAQAQHACCRTQFRGHSAAGPSPASSLPQTHLRGSSVRPQRPSDQASIRGKSSRLIASSCAAADCSMPCTAAGLPAPGPQAASHAASAASRKAACCGCCSAGSTPSPSAVLSLSKGAVLSQAASTCAQASCSSPTRENSPSCCAANLQAMREAHCEARSWWPQQPRLQCTTAN